MFDLVHSLSFLLFPDMVTMTMDDDYEIDLHTYPLGFVLQIGYNDYDNNDGHKNSRACCVIVCNPVLQSPLPLSNLGCLSIPMFRGLSHTMFLFCLQRIITGRDLRVLQFNRKLDMLGLCSLALASALCYD